MARENRTGLEQLRVTGGRPRYIQDTLQRAIYAGPGGN